MIEIKAHMRGGSQIPAHRRRPRATTGGRVKSRTLCVRMSAETFDRVRMLAEDRNRMTMSDFVRSLLDIL